MSLKQQDIAQNDMAQWLADPHELGREPGRIECAGEFELHGMRYYIFKFKTGVLSPWLVGVSGGYEGDSLTPCCHTFSEVKKYRADTAQEDCAAMVEKIRAYWMAQAEKFTQQ